MKTANRATPFGLLLLTCLIAAPPLWARSPGEAPAGTLHAPNIDVSLLSAADTVVPGRPFDVAVRLAPDPGWHSYWRNPGDTGLPTRITWHLPQGGHAGPIEWPAPVRVVHGIVVPLSNEAQRDARDPEQPTFSGLPQGYV